MRKITFLINLGITLLLFLQACKNNPTYEKARKEGKLDKLIDSPIALTTNLNNNLESNTKKEQVSITPEIVPIQSKTSQQSSPVQKKISVPISSPHLTPNPKVEEPQYIEYDFKPFTIKDHSLNEVTNDLTLVKSEAYLLKQPFAIEMGLLTLSDGVEVSFFKEIADFYRLSNNRSYWPKDFFHNPHTLYLLKKLGQQLHLALYNSYKNEHNEIFKDFAKVFSELYPSEFLKGKEYNNYPDGFCINHKIEINWKLKNPQLTQCQDLYNNLLATIEQSRNTCPSVFYMQESADSSPDHVFKALGNLLGVFVKMNSINVQSELNKLTDKFQELQNSVPESFNCFESKDGYTLGAGAIKRHIKHLQLEIEDAKWHFQHFNSLGTLKAFEDRQIAQGRGLIRQGLPFPSVTDEERILFAWITGGVTWRARGGGVFFNPESTNGKRNKYTTDPFKVYGQIGGADGLEVGETMFLGLLDGWGKWFDMGRNETQEDKYSDLANMTSRGKRQVSYTRKALELKGYDSEIIKVGGVVMGGCYYFPWELLYDYHIDAKYDKPFKEFLLGATAWGEFCAGASIAVGVTYSLLNGYKSTKDQIKDLF